MIGTAKVQRFITVRESRRSHTEDEKIRQSTLYAARIIQPLLNRL